MVVGGEADVGHEAASGRAAQQVRPAARAAGDPALAGEVGEVVRAASGRHDGQHRVAVQRLAHEVALDRRAVERVAEHHRDVQLAAAHGRLRLGRLELDEAHVEPRRPSEQVGEHRREQHRRGRRERADPHLPRHQPGQRGEVLLGCGEPLGDGVGVPQQHAPGLGQGDAAAGAHHERRAGVGLEAADVLADGGLRPPQGAGRTGERAGAADLAEDEQAAGVHPDTQAPTPKHRLGRPVEPAVLCTGCGRTRLPA